MIKVLLLWTLVWAVSPQSHPQSHQPSPPPYSIHVPLGPAKSSYNECSNCHRTKKITHVPKAHSPKKEHDHIRLEHGQKKMSCNFCHDKTNHNLLADLNGKTIPFRQSSPVCQTCHSDIYKDWMNGLHGRRDGGWRPDQKRMQSQCVFCHNAHEVRFDRMKAEPPPARPQFGIPKKNH